MSINHEAMPDFNKGLDLLPGANLALISTVNNIKLEGAERTFRKMVEWLEEHNQAEEWSYFKNGGLAEALVIASKDWQSLLDAVKEKGI